MPPAKSATLTPRSPGIRKALALLLGLFFALAAAEAALRLGGFLSALSQEKRNLTSGAQNGLRVMCLGESTTAGADESWPGRLERLLAERYPAARFSVINKAIPGATTSGLLRNLEKDLDEVRPGLVIAMMGINDGFRGYYSGIDGAEGPLFRHFRLYKLYRILLNNLRAARPRREPGGAGNRSGGSGRSDPYNIFHDGKSDPGLQERRLRAALERDPDDAAALYLLGTYWTRGVAGRDTDPARWSAGEKMLRRAARLDPGNSFAFWNLGLYYSSRGELGRAGAMLEEAARLDPSPQHWSDLGKLYLRRDLPARAEKALLKALAAETSPEALQDSFFTLCRLYIDRGEHPKAEKLLEDRLRLEPDNEKLHGALANLYLESGRPDLALSSTKKLTRGRAMFTEETRASFLKLQSVLARRGIRLAVMQYPMSDPAPLRELFDDPDGVVFIDNDRVFKEAVRKKGYARYFVDMFAGNFGHCTRPGNELIARSAADALAAYFGEAAGQNSRAGP